MDYGSFDYAQDRLLDENLIIHFTILILIPCFATRSLKDEGVFLCSLFYWIPLKIS